MTKKNYYIGVAELKDILKQKSQSELVSLLIESFKDNDYVKEYLSARYGGEKMMENILVVYKNKIDSVFFPNNYKAGFKLSGAKKVISDFKKLCSNEKLVLDLMLYYVEQGVAFTNTFGDINEAFYESLKKIYWVVIEAVNKHSEPLIYNLFKDRLRVVLDNTGGISWGFYDDLNEMYYRIKWLGSDEINIDINSEEATKIKEYIIERLKKRNDIVNIFKDSVEETVTRIINADEIFLKIMNKSYQSFSNDEEYNYISGKTGDSFRLVEFVLWQRYCYEMEHDYWKYNTGSQCKKCNSSELYLKEVPDTDFADRIVCRKCGAEFDNSIDGLEEI